MQQKSVLITGASTGIGKACALYLEAQGYRVFAGVRRAEDGAALLQEASGTLQPLLLDVCDGESVAAAVRQVAAVLGGTGLSGLVNNAGISVAGPLEFLPLEDLRRQLEVNVIGQVAVTQACLPLLRQARGRIVMISSTSGLFALPFLGPYAASKFALEALSDSLRVELRPWGMAVIVVEPGAIATPIWEKSLAEADAMRTRLPAQAEGYYHQVMEGTRAYAQKAEERGLPAEAVARVVAQALTARRPRVRYQVVGTGSAVLFRLVRLVPTPLRDWLVARRLR